MVQLGNLGEFIEGKHIIAIQQVIAKSGLRHGSCSISTVKRGRLGKKMNKMITKYALVFISLLILITPAAFAQNVNLIQDRIRLELERTDEIIARAREMVRTSNAPASAIVLEQAITLQDLAWGNFRKNTVDGYNFALKQTLQAREQAKQALSNSRFSEQGEDAVLNRLERTEDLLRQAHEEMPTTVDESLSTIFDSARRNLAQAWELYRNGRYRPALKMANQVERTAKRLLQIANRQQNHQANFLRRLEAVKQFIDRVQEEVNSCQSEPAHSLIQKAKGALQQALDLSSKGHFEAALQNLQQARKLAADAADLCGRSKEFSNNLERLKNEAERLRELIRPGDENEMRLLDQVFGQLENAREFLARQDSQGVAAAIRAAQLTIRQLERYLDSGEL